jgi:hypothetical protein
MIYRRWLLIAGQISSKICALNLQLTPRFIDFNKKLLAKILNLRYE